jgi:hypothetical protein
VTSSTSKAAGFQHLSHDDVVHLIGDLDDSTVSTILASGASYVDIEQAVKWLESGFDEARLNSHRLTPKGEMVCDILLTSGTFDDNGDRLTAAG